MSIFAHLMKDAAAVITESHAERDQHGELATITCTLPDGKPVKLVGVIIHQLKENGEIETAIGTHKRDELEQEVLLTIPRDQAGNQFTPADETCYYLPQFGEERKDEPFVQQSVDSLTHSFASVRVTRELVTAIQRGSVERD